MPALWLALRDVVRFWVDQGVRLFRVDNPHTKPFPFWEWLIADIRAQSRTRCSWPKPSPGPKVMYRLAKVGFSQSYTYFTWRNEKAEIQEYLAELTTRPRRATSSARISSSTRPTSTRSSCRPRGRAGFLIRAALATTLSGPLGHVPGLRAVRGGAAAGPRGISGLREIRDPRPAGPRPGDIVEEITRLN